VKEEEEKRRKREGEIIFWLIILSIKLKLQDYEQRIYLLFFFS